jgi:hypothetical protein
MFKQIQANKIVDILKNLEQEDLKNSDIQMLLDNLKNKTEELFAKWNKEIL